MDNEESNIESKAVEETTIVTDKDSTNTTNAVPGETETSEVASTEKSTQNGALEPKKMPTTGDNQTEDTAIESVTGETEPQITENGDPDKTDQADTEKLEQDKATVDSIVEATKNIIEEKPTRVTRGAKRKRDDEMNETIGEESNNAVIEQKENQNDSLHVTGENTTMKSYPSSNVMGKGRRARVPNKRYSDIALTPNKRAQASAKVPMVALEESLSVKDELVGDFAGFDSAITAATSAKKSKDSSKFQDPKYLKPFKYGWKRELVWRSTNVPGYLKMGDIYYYDPTGKKLRSIREISDHLNNKNLTLDNFSFFKEPLGLNDPDKEIVRNAGESRKPNNTAAPSKNDSLVVGTAATTSGNKRRATLGPINAAQEKEKEVASPTATRNRRKSPVKKGRSSTAKKPRESDLSTAEPMEVDIAPIKSGVVKTSKPCPPCSISCEGLQGIIPMLQCRMCLCLYHYQCVGLDTDKISRYVCKNCQDQEQTPSSAIALPPPLEPIMKPPLPVTNTTKVKRAQRPEFVVPLPVLLPRPSLAKKVNFKEPTITEMPTLTPKPQESSSSLVGALTSYHPHNVQILSSAETTIMSRPQTIEYINGRRFMIIPKHNYMSVSSNTSRTDNASSSGPKISLESNQEVPEAIGFSPSEGGKSPVREEVEKIEDDDVQAVPGDKDDNVKNESSARHTTQGLNQPKGQTRTQIQRVSSGFSESESRFMGSYMQNISFGYNTLISIFQYLKVQDLVRAGVVCTMWRDISSNPILWRTVRMKNSQVYSFKGLAATLKKYNTVNLDLRKVLLPNNGDDIWPEFSKHIGIVGTLRKIEFCRCPAFVIEQLPISNPDLEVINAIMIKSDTMNIDSFRSLKHIRELKIKAITSMALNSISSLKELKTLKVLALTSVLHLNELDLSVLAELTNLESLDLGECTDFPATFGEDVLIKLEHLEKLRLEKGQDNCHTFEILKTVKDMKKLEQLELINFDIKAGFDNAIGECTGLKKLMIIPTYVSQSATTNNMVLSGVLRLQETLTHFVWGVTLELIRVTELFVDQCEDKKNKKATTTNDSIPVLKPVPDLSDGGIIQPATNPPQVEILPLPNLQKLLLNSLPSTRVKILKIPFHATWRQSLHDSAYL